MVDSSEDIIDLCDSFILADHQALTNVVIELDTDDSIILDSDNSMVVLTHSNSSRTSTVSTKSQSGKLKQKQKTKLKSQKIQNEAICDELENRFGDCPICFEALGQNPLASTKCGHVYCIKCLQQYLSFDQRCPTCRQSLRGRFSYHPLYLNK